MMNDTAPKPRNVASLVDPTDHAHNPDTEFGAHPAAAGLGTDEEAGRRAPRPANDADRDDVYTVDSNGEVRAGPGDAGAQDVPRVLDDPRGKPRRSGIGMFAALFIGVPVLVLLIWLLAS